MYMFVDSKPSMNVTSGPCIESCTCIRNRYMLTYMRGNTVHTDSVRTQYTVKAVLVDICKLDTLAWQKQYLLAPSLYMY